MSETGRVFCRPERDHTYLHKCYCSAHAGETFVPYSTAYYCYLLGSAYLELEEIDQARTMLFRAVQFDPVSAKFLLGFAEVFKQNQDFAFRLFLHTAEEGIAAACFYVGHYLQEGIAVEQDPELAVEWFKRGAEQEDAVCIMELGRCYCLGLGLEKDPGVGVGYYERAGELGDALAWANVGYAYETGQGVRKNLYLAEYYYKKGAELGEEHCIEALQRLVPSGKSGMVGKGEKLAEKPS